MVAGPVIGEIEYIYQQAFILELLNGKSGDST